MKNPTSSTIFSITDGSEIFPDDLNRMAKVIDSASCEALLSLPLFVSRIKKISFDSVLKFFIKETSDAFVFRFTRCLVFPKNDIR